MVLLTILKLSTEPNSTLYRDNCQSMFCCDLLLSLHVIKKYPVLLPFVRYVESPCYGQSIALILRSVRRTTLSNACPSKVQSSRVNSSVLVTSVLPLS